MSFASCLISRLRALSLIGATLFAVFLLLPYGMNAQTVLVKIPAGEPMGPDPVTPKAKLQEKHATFDGVERTWYEYVPASYTGNSAVPLVVAVHGGTADGVWMFNATAWAQIADQAGFIVVYPNGSIGTGNKLRWNAYPEFNSDPRMAISSDNKVDEAKFFKQLIEKTEQTYKINTTRIYMHGQSKGGIMTSYFALRYPEMLAAMGASSAPPSIDVMGRYPIHTPLPTYFWSGETDTVAGQYNPQNKSRATLCKEFAEFWARIDHSDMQPKLRLDGPYNTLIYSGNAEVRSTEFRNGVHTLPFTAAYLLWNEFFTRYVRSKDGSIVHLVPDANQPSGPDANAVAIKLGAPFAWTGGKVIRIGETPAQLPRLVPGAPSAGVVVPARFAATAFSGKVETTGNAGVQFTTNAGTATLTVATTKMFFNGKSSTLDVPTTMIDGDAMVSLRAIAVTILGKSQSTRHDVYRNDIYYVSDRPADLSAQTITFLDSKLTGESQ